MTLAAGTHLGPYEVLSPMGAGGMGEVYRARDERLGRDVAIKVLPAEVASDSERLKRFEKEARSQNPQLLIVEGENEGIRGFDAKGENAYVVSGQVSMRIDRLELATGKRTFFREIALADPTGVGSTSSLQITPDGRSYCYSFMRALSRLYVVDGLR